MTDKQLEYEEWVARLLAKNVEMATYECPDCRETIYTQIPDSGQYDSMCVCPFCNELHFKVVESDGTVRIS
ncbi:MAG: hypothetical protein OQK32_00480 [Gammaproteobacteria bacterium]|nr:hypothetical protein [Gammaproteobacteria bacterium]MCW8924092.1 hypothetical protein [Gammaproteobacteria bacterium]